MKRTKILLLAVLLAGGGRSAMAQNLKVFGNSIQSGTKVIYRPTQSATAKKGNPLKSFTIEAPDTVVQGTDFTVTYTLKATTWDNGKAPKGKNVVLRNVEYNKEWDRSYSTLITKAIFTTSCTGDIELPAMTIPVNGNEVKSETKHVFVMPNPEYGKEMTTAHEWLLKKGASDSLCLTKELANDQLVVFSDNQRDNFAVVAKADVWDKLRQPVLAYSTESHMYNPNNSTYKVLLSLYESQIDSLREASMTSSAATEWNGAVAPLLGNIQWGQNEPYNTRSPQVNGHRILIGCVPLAMSMVMKYHEWPKQGESDVYISPENAQLFNYKFPNFAPKWSEYRDEYDKKETAAASDLAQTLGVLSLCTDPDIMIGSVAVNLGRIKHVFCNNLKYSGRIAVEQIEGAGAQEVYTLLRNELDSHRPCIVSRGQHAFACDGYDGEFFHYNVGWHGYANGYYQLAIAKDGGGTNLLDAIVYGMEPRREELNKTVTLAKANTLRSMLTEQEQQNLTSLTIIGPIGSDDVRLLRQMSGATDNNERVQYPWGALQQLDLSKAKIVKDKGCYLTCRASGKWWRTRTTGEYNLESGLGHTYVDTKTFDFDKMDEKQWNAFKAYIGTKQDGIYYTRTDDNKYWENYNLQANTVGIHMFTGCSSLRDIILPETTKRIDKYAFTGCQSLQVMKIPVKTKELGETPFNYCVSLAELWLPKGIQYEGKINDHCSPAFRAHAYE